MTKQQPNLSNNPHDQFFRRAMTHKQVARAFLTTWLPQELTELVNFEILESQTRSYINDINKESAVDVLFKTKIAEQEAYLYLLLEHQSTPDPLMPFRILKYVCNVIDHHLKTHKTNKIPLVYPMVVYHGKQKYTCSNDINDLVNAPKELVQKYFLKPFQLLDLGQIDDEILKQEAWSGLMFLALKHIFARDILPYLQELAGIFQELEQEDGQDFITLVLEYLFKRGECIDRKAFLNLVDTKIKPNVGDNIMTLAEILRQEGR